MREIKFRAWYPALKKMDYDPYADEFICEGTPLNQAVTAFPDGVELMQYTGLRDKYGVEIYEGDIVKQYDIAYWSSVKYSDGAFRLRKGFILHGGEDIEVIGNIYENPDILDRAV